MHVWIDYHQSHLGSTLDILFTIYLHYFFVFHTITHFFTIPKFNIYDYESTLNIYASKKKILAKLNRFWYITYIVFKEVIYTFKMLWRKRKYLTQRTELVSSVTWWFSFWYASNLTICILNHFTCCKYGSYSNAVIDM